MPLTPAQASPATLINSLKDFLVTNVVTPYNTQVSTTTYPKPLNIVLGIPDDPDLALDVPLLVIEPLPKDVQSVHAVGMGDGIVWRYKQIFLCCYPAITTDGKPSVQAMNSMMALLDYALGTALYIPIKDFSQTPAVQVEAAQVMDVRMYEPRGHVDPNLAIEKNRFDYRLTVRYPQLTING